MSAFRTFGKPYALVALMIWSILSSHCVTEALAMPFSPGEKLRYALRWENVPAGELLLEIHPVTDINGTRALHFVMIARSNSFVDIFCKIRDRIDAYATPQMTRSVFYQKKQSGSRGLRKEMVTFDWTNHKVQFSDLGKTYEPIKLLPGSFDPLSAFYYTRLAVSDNNTRIKRPVTDGKRSVIGNARVVGRETITLSNGKRYDTLVLEPETALLGGVFKDSKGAKLQLWVTADDKRIPVQIKTKVKVGHFVGELVSAEGV